MKMGSFFCCIETSVGITYTAKKLRYGCAAELYYAGAEKVKILSENSKKMEDKCKKRVDKCCLSRKKVL